MTKKEKERLERIKRNEAILQEVKDENEKTDSIEEDYIEEIVEECIEDEMNNLTDEHKQAIRDEVTRLLNSKEFKEKTKKESTKKQKQKTEYSKKVTTSAVVLAYLFILFVCYEMHRLQNLEPVAYIGAGIVIMLAICVKAYMKRAYQADLVNVKVIQAEKLSELKEKYGDNFVYEHIEDVTLDGT